MAKSSQHRRPGGELDQSGTGEDMVASANFLMDALSQNFDEVSAQQLLLNTTIKESSLNKVSESLRAQEAGTKQVLDVFSRWR